MSGRLTVTAVPGLPEVVAGDDLSRMVVDGVADLADGDVVVVTSKIVSKAEGRVVRTDRDAAIADETVRVVARRGPTTIARTRHGLTLAAAGVDASNVEPGSVVLLPDDPDGSARALRTRIWEATARNVAVVVSDTAGRPWREGQTDIAVGCAGLVPLDDHAGRHDTLGNPLAVTAPALADEVAAAADLVLGKVTGRPVAVVRGLDDHVLPVGSHGSGAAALIRDPAADMFALGAVEAAWTVVLGDDPTAVSALTVSAASVPMPLQHLVDRAGAGHGATLRLHMRDDGDGEVRGADDDLPTSAALERLCALARLHGWQVLRDERTEGRCVLLLRRLRDTP